MEEIIKKTWQVCFQLNEDKEFLSNFYRSLQKIGQSKTLFFINAMRELVANTDLTEDETTDTPTWVTSGRLILRAKNELKTDISPQVIFYHRVNNWKEGEEYKPIE